MLPSLDALAGSSAMGNSKERPGANPNLLRVYKVLPCCVRSRRSGQTLALQAEALRPISTVGAY